MVNTGLSGPDQQIHKAAVIALKDALHNRHKARIRVNGTSMLPVIRPGDILIIKSARLEDCAIGDILTVARSADIVTHRLIKMTPSELILKADNILIPDDPVPVSEMLGIVIGIERNGSYLNIRKNVWRLFNRWMGWLGAREAQIVQRARNHGNQVEAKPGSIHRLFASVRRYFLKSIVGLLWRLGK